MINNLKNFCNFFNKFIPHFSFCRLRAVIIKEFIQLRRDRLTFAMVIAIPIMQLILFGYAINTNPKNLPTVVIASDYSNFTRAFIYGLKNTTYFDIKQQVKNEAQAKQLLETFKTQFVITIPPYFTHDLLQGNRPSILVEADATDPVATASALAAIQALSQTVFNPLLTGSLASLRASSPPINIITHANYNPEDITQYNIVPGLLGTVLTLTLVTIAGSCITREIEKGTMEHLLSTPVRPLEVMIGKVTPFIILGYIQFSLIIIAAKYLFYVPFQGSIILLFLVALPFIASNLSVGLTFSSLSKSQLQAGQMSTFFFLPSLLLSGFMFPFRGMPLWAQYIGNLLPLTHFLRIARGITLKGNGLAEIWPDLWPIILFMLVAVYIGLKRYRQTLD